MVTVINRADAPDGWYRDERYVYIGRPGILGNPFTTQKHGGRETVVEMYHYWLRGELATGHNRPLIEAFWAIPQDAILVCHCKPLLCHGDVIADILNARAG